MAYSLANVMASLKSNIFNDGSTHYSLEKWIDIWEKDMALFHDKDLNIYFKKYLDHLWNGQGDITVFFPLCGKAVEMRFIHDLGHQVVGVEVASKALEEFFVEQKMGYTVDFLPNGGKVFKSNDERIRLYCMDMFDFGPHLERKINAVWDRGSLEAVNTDDREKYTKVVCSVLAEDFRYLLACFEYDPDEYPGPPHSFTQKDIEKAFAKVDRPLSVTHLESQEENEDLKKLFEVTNLKKCVYLLKPPSLKVIEGDAE